MLRRDQEVIIFDPDIDRTERRIRRKKRVIIQSQMAENGGQRITLGDYSRPTGDGEQSSIVRPAVGANNFELKPALLQLIRNDQFAGHDSEDPNLHLANFLQICDTIKINGVSDDAIRLRLFPFSLRDRAICWLQAQPRGSITTWADLTAKFMIKYFPPSKFARLRNEITCFQQKEGETLLEALDRYKELLRNCPNHGIPELQQVSILYNGVKPSTRMLIDASAGGSLSTKTAEEAMQLIEIMASNECMVSERNAPTRGVMELNLQDALLAQSKLMTQALEKLTSQIADLKKPSQACALSCDFCGGDHRNEMCEVQEQTKQVNYMGQQGNRNYMSNS